jgi:hypothetical protein
MVMVPDSFTSLNRKTAELLVKSALNNDDDDDDDDKQLEHFTYCPATY